MAETIKHACLASREMFEFIEENLDDIMSFQKFACEYIAENNCKIKYDVVMKDERESGLREVLNLGHTVGRAIETVSDYRPCTARHFPSEWRLWYCFRHALAICQRKRKSV